jgi:hypothetical protein
MGQISFPKKSARNCHHTPRKLPEQRSYHLRIKKNYSYINYIVHKILSGSATEDAVETTILCKAHSCYIPLLSPPPLFITEYYTSTSIVRYIKFLIFLP